MFLGLKGFREPTVWMIPVIVGIVFALHLFHFVDFRELDAVDLKFRIRGEKPAHSSVVLVMIDDPSLVTFGRWPWPRGLYSVFLDILSRYSPRTVFFDLLFMEEGPDPNDDEKLRVSIQKAGNVILPFFYGTEKPFQALFPIPPLRDAAYGVAYANLISDRDGRVRRFKAFLDTDQGRFYHPAVLTMLMAKGQGQASNLPDELPLDARRDLWINYPGSFSSFHAVSFADVVRAAGMNREEELKRLFSGSIVIIGHTATGTGLVDIKPTPFSVQEPGVMVLASAFHTLLSGQIPRPLSDGAHFLILLILSALVTFYTRRATPFRGLLFATGISVIYGLTSILCFIFWTWLIPLFVPIAVIGLSYFVTLFLKFMEVRFQKELSERELQAAFQIQANFLPQTLPKSEGLDAAFECKFSKGVGGDLYAWVDLGAGKFGFCVGDVSGKGMPAALYMAKAVSDFRSIEKQNLSAGEVCTRLNQILTAAGISHMFLTFWYGVVDLGARKLTFANAGHERMLFYRDSSKHVEVVEGVEGMPLGMFEDSSYETNDLALQEGDAFLLYTDGVKELRNSKREEFGVERLRQAMQKLALERSSPAKTILGIFEQMEVYREGFAAHDDRTLLCLKILKL